MSSTHIHWLPTAVVSVSYESVCFSAREAMSVCQRRMKQITGLFSV